MSDTKNMKNETDKNKNFDEQAVELQQNLNSCSLQDFSILFKEQIEQKKYKDAIKLLMVGIYKVRFAKKEANSYSYSEFSNVIFRSFNIYKIEELFIEILKEDLTPTDIAVIAWFYTIYDKQKGVDLALDAIKQEPDNPILYHLFMEHLRSLIACWHDYYDGNVDDSMFYDTYDANYVEGETSDNIYYKKIAEICDIFDYAVRNYPANKGTFIESPVDSNHIYYFDFLTFFSHGDNYKKMIHCYEMGEYLKKPSENIYCRMGDCYIKLKEYEKAVLAYRKSIRCGEKTYSSDLEKTTDAKHMLVSTFLAMKKHEDAAKVIAKIFDYKKYLNLDIKKYGSKDFYFSKCILIHALTEYDKGNKELAGKILIKYREHYNKTLLKREKHIVNGYSLGDDPMFLLLSANVDFMLYALEIIFNVKCSESLHEIYNFINEKKFNFINSIKFSSTPAGRMRCWDYIDLLKKLVPEYRKDDFCQLDVIYQRNGEDIFFDRFKRGLLEHFIASAPLSSLDKKTLLKRGALQRMHFTIIQSIKEQEFELEKKRELKHQQEISEARLAERDKVIADLSHSIKNIINKLTSPLRQLRDQGNANTVNRALKGAELIRDIINGFNYSYSGSFEDFIYDAKQPESSALSFEDILIDSLMPAIEKMFDGKWFKIFLDQYFPSKEIFTGVKQEWENLKVDDLNQLQLFCQQNIFDCKFEVENIKQLKIGKTKGSELRFLILFQELILNAVKYTSFVEREQRFIEIRLNYTEQQGLNLVIANSFSVGCQEKGTGLGHVIVETMCKLMQAEYKKRLDNEQGTFTVEINFPDYWHYDTASIEHQYPVELDVDKYAIASEEQVNYKT